MTYQPDLFRPFGTLHATQQRLFDGTPVETELACAVCGKFLIQTESGFACCPMGHGRLVADVAGDTACGSLFEEGGDE